MKRIISIIVVSILLGCFIGCASSHARHDGGGIYPGVREDIDTFMYPAGMMLSGPFWDFFGRIIGLIDFPFSFALDTFLLPYDALHSHAEPKKDLGNINITKESDNNKVDEEELNNSLKRE